MKAFILLAAALITFGLGTRIASATPAVISEMDCYTNQGTVTPISSPIGAGLLICVGGKYDGTSVSARH